MWTILDNGNIMSGMGYTKLFNELVASTVWREPDHVRILWITMLAMKDRWHVVRASLPGLADCARITIPQCENALKVLSSPDKYSRTQTNEGRRVATCDGGWEILNGEKYRNMMNADERREYQRLKKREYRAKAKDGVQSCPQKSKQFTHTEADTKALSKEKQEKESYPEWWPTEAWGAFVDHRKQIKKPLTKIAAKRIINKLTEANAETTLWASIENGWSGVFPDGGKNGKGKQSGRTLSAVERVELANGINQGRTLEGELDN